MQSWTPLLSLLLFTCMPDALAKRGGGGGSSHGDSDDDSRDSNGNGGGGEDDSFDPDPSRCAPEELTVWKWDLVPDTASNYSDRVDGSFAGSFFEGKASLNITITDHDDLCDPTNDTVTQMLGYAWIGPRPPLHQEGTENDFILGFKAWESDLPLDEIEESYAYIDLHEYGCVQQPDLFRVTTTHSWIHLDRHGGINEYRAADFMDFSVTKDPEDRDRVLLNATMPEEPLRTVRAEDPLLIAPKGICGGPPRFTFGFPDRLAVYGSLTNNTLDLNLVGSGDATASVGDTVYEVTAEFNVSFSGVFDSDNSTQEVRVKQAGKGPLIAWASGSSSHVAPFLGCLSSSLLLMLLILL